LRAFDSREQFVYFRPILFAGGFDVINLCRNSCFPTDSDQFIKRFEQPVSLAADVRDVPAPEGRNHLGEGDDL